jgi:hypothetical protein
MENEENSSSAFSSSSRGFLGFAFFPEISDSDS